LVSALVLFKLSGQAPHTDPTIIFAILTAVYGAVFSFIVGLVAQLIAKTTYLKINYGLAFYHGRFCPLFFNQNQWQLLDTITGHFCVCTTLKK